MTSGIKVGFSMHPRWVSETGLGAFLSPLRSAGLSALEFELDDHLDMWPEFGPLMEEAASMGMHLSFHAPYRPPHSLAGFSSARRSEIEQDYAPLLDIAAAWAHRDSDLKTVVVHAATAKPPARRDELYADTIAFLEWTLGAYPGLLLALENNHPETGNQIRIGVAHEDVLRIINELRHPRLRVCWDMGHDFLHGSAHKLEQEWLAEVIHVHLHDVNEMGVDHFPLVYGNVPFRDWLHALKRAGMKGSVVMELKGQQLKDWQPQEIQKALIDSIRALTKEVG